MNVNMSAATVVYKDYMFFSARDFNGLMRTNIKTGETEYVCRFESEDNIEYLHIKAFVYKNEIWFIPGYGEYIACVNVDTLDISYFDIPYNSLNMKYKMNPSFNKNGKNRLKSLDAGRYKEHKLFLVSACTDTIVVIDMISKEIIPYHDVIDTEKEFMGYGAIYEDVLWMVPYAGGHLIALNLESKSVMRIKLDPTMEKTKIICTSDGKVWFAPRKMNFIVYYDIDERKYYKIYDEGRELFNESSWYKDIIEYKNEIWLLPGDSNDIVKINPNTLSIKKMDFGVKLVGERMVDSDINKLYMVSYDNSRVSWVEEEPKKISSIIIQIEDSYFLTILKIIYGENALEKYYKSFSGIVKENQMGIENFLLLIDEISTEKNIVASKLVGCEIWNS